eukprot:TRINITY_DN17921_c1_g1_i2.p1 TRINITY_DN17921_c1_g1~~TRINITY_DN17921_c1_g1_i2.p1  ORF type:complete len:535 (+),score=138.98 TRINITY_DN17921_c1_g1_i2:362-1966(+)
MDESNMYSAMAENEVAALKEALYAQHQLMQKLCVELEVEREASTTAVNEALSMILRLQGEKAVEKMEANQYRRVTEEKMHHAEQSLAVFEELLYRKEMEIASLFFQLEAYKHKLFSLGFTDLDIGETKLPKNRPLHEGYYHLDEVGVWKTVGQSLSLPFECCKGSNSMEQCVERGASYSTKRENPGGTTYESNTEIGAKNQWNNMIENEELSQIHDETQNMFTESTVEDCSSYWERIEQMTKRVQELSHCKSADEGFTSEWVLANKELQVTIAAYSASLRAGSRTCSSNLAVTRKPLYVSTTGLETVLDTGSSLTCASSEAEDTENLSDFNSCSMPCVETEMDGNIIHCTSVHDIYEVPQNLDSHQLCDQNLDSHQLCDPQKQVAQKRILEVEKRLEELDLEKKESVEHLSKDDAQWIMKAMPYAHHEENFSALSSVFKMDGDWVAMDPKNRIASSQVEVQQLKNRLRLLENDTRIMKQEASERRDEEIKLLKAICEQLKIMQSQMSSRKADKHSPLDESLLAFAMEAMLSFSI